jgi:hypothetical protein
LTSIDRILFAFIRGFDALQGSIAVSARIFSSQGARLDALGRLRVQVLASFAIDQKCDGNPLDSQHSC